MSNTTAGAPACITAGVEPIKLNLINIIWVGHKDQEASLRFRRSQVKENNSFGASDETTEDSKDWRKVIVSPAGSDPDEPFPETDSNGNPCRILDYDPTTGIWTQSGTYAYVAYPDGQQRKLPLLSAYERHTNRKMCHFALAALAAWTPGEARNFPSAWHTYERGGDVNASTAITPVMWERATIQGYLKPSDLGSLRSSDKRIRTDKPVNANIKRSRKLKSSVWPFSEKEHWFNVMSGALQITHNNMTQTLRAPGTSLGSRERDMIRKSFPVFSTKAEFKRARKFLEHLSTKKNTEANRVDLGTPAGMSWDPLKQVYNSIGGRTYDSQRSNTDLFSSPYTLVKTSLMLGCVPDVDANGTISDYRQITADYISELQYTPPMIKSVVGTWKGGNGWDSRKEPIYSTDVYDSVNVDNLTHMYMILLNEARLLSNDALVRWAAHQNLIMHKLDFNSNFLHNYDYDIFGYKLTDTLDYTCVVWSDPTSD